MKSRQAFFLLSFFIFPWTTTLAQMVEGSALLIGISHYQNKDWRYSADGRERILASNRDIVELKKLLIEKGYPVSGITTLEDDAATKEGIEAAIDKLIDRAKPGSNVLFHFSGHGQQVYDRAPQLDEVDGFDEALVPTDAPMHFDAALVNSEKHLRDDYLHAKFNLLRRKLGPEGTLTVVIDACHSGSATRGQDDVQGTARGSSGAYMPQDYSPPMLKEWNRETFETVDAGATLSPMVCFYACGPGELNYEARGISIGSLTYAFINALNRCDNQCSYFSLFENMKETMRSVAPNQRPQLEGDADRKIFNGKFRNTSTFFTVASYKRPGSCILKAGSLNGLGRGTRVALYLPDQDTAVIKPLCYATIDSVRLSSCIAFIDSGKAVPPELAERAWVYPLKILPPFSVNVNIGATNFPRLRSAVQANSFAMLSESDAHLNTVFNKRKDSIVFINRYGYRVGALSWKNQDSLEQHTAKILLRSARAEFFRNIRGGGNPKLKARLDFTPHGYRLEKRIRNGREVMAPVMADTLAKSLVYDRSGNIRIKDTTFLQIGIEALSLVRNEDMYYALLDIQPDDLVNLITNGKKLNKQPDEFLVERSEKRAVFPQPVRISPPYGPECFVLLTAFEPLDFSGIAGVRGNNSEISYFYNELEEGNGAVLSRGRPAVVNEVGVVLLKFEIIR